MKAYNDRWATTKIDSLSVAMAINLAKRCQIGQKIVFHDNVPIIVDKTMLELFIDRLMDRIQKERK